MKRGVIFLFFFLIAIISVNAQISSYNKQDAVDWLYNNTKGDESTVEISMSLLALNSNGYRIDGPLTVFLQRNLDSPCFPKGSCTIKDTSFALYSLGKLNQDTSKIEEWLRGNLKNAEVGKWFVQITSSSQGTCSVRNGDKEINVDLNENGDIVFNGNNIGSWLDVERYLNPIEGSSDVSVNCPTLGSNMIISLLRQRNSNEFIIAKEVNSNTATFSIDNSCYGISGCNVESSFYAAWALNELGKETKVTPYLEDSAADNVLYNTILHKVEDKEKYASKVANSQGVNGDFGNNIFTTSLAVDSIRENSNYYSNVTKSLVWLQSRQVRNDVITNGSIGGTKFFTGSVLYLALKEGSVTVPSQRGTSGYCGDNVVDTNLGEQCDLKTDTKAEGAQKDCENRCDVLTCECNEVQCNSNLQCNIPREYCNTGTSQCVVNSTITSCKSNLDCKDNEKCDIVSGGFCVPRGGEVAVTGCKSNSDCNGINEVCNIDTGRCEDEEVITRPEVEEVCGDGLCSINENEDICAEDCKKDVGLPIWIWVVVFILGLLIIAYIIFAKFVNQAPKTRGKRFSMGDNERRESPKQEYYRPLERDHKDEALERELDRSIKEAQDLLKRK